MSVVNMCWHRTIVSIIQTFSKLVWKIRPVSAFQKLWTSKHRTVYTILQKNKVQWVDSIRFECGYVVCICNSKNIIRLVNDHLFIFLNFKKECDHIPIPIWHREARLLKKFIIRGSKFWSKKTTRMFADDLVSNLL